MNASEFYTIGPFKFRRRTTHRLALLVIVFAVAICPFVRVYSDSVSRYTYDQIQIGMSREAVEAILGAGTKIPLEEVPEFQGASGAMRVGNHYYLVDGEEFYRWSSKHIAVAIVVGMRQGKVSGKHFVDMDYP